MKKITFILFALIAGTTFAQQETYTATDGASASAEIIQPITITKTTDLNFGRIIGNFAGGEVTLSTAGARGGDADLLDMSSLGTTGISAAEFTITAASGYSYTIQYPETLLIGTTDQMLVTFEYLYGTTAIDATANPISYSGAGTAGGETLKIGGTLDVNGEQAEGSYSADFDVTVTYE
jgi:hypothetical protein